MTRTRNAAPVLVACDSNALDRDGTDRALCVQRFRELASSGMINVIATTGVQAEIANPQTPVDVRDAMPVATVKPPHKLTQQQQISRFCVQSILGGDARAEKHAADATHLSEAAEAGCAYFITHDKRILKKRTEMADVLPPSLRIVTLREFFEHFDDAESLKSR